MTTKKTKKRPYTKHKKGYWSQAAPRQKFAQSIIEDDDDIYPSEAVVYMPALMEQRYRKTVLSVALLQPNTACTIPIGDIKGITPHSFLQGARKRILEDPKTKKLPIKGTVLRVFHRNREKVTGVRFYRLPE